jgi:integrase
VDSEKRRAKMKSVKISIRPRYVRCPHCLDRYVRLPDGSILCPGCDNKNPSSYFLDFYHSGRQQIFCDERGIILDTKARAELLSEQIKYEIDRGTFTAEKYKSAELTKYWTDALLGQFWKIKEKKVAPSSLRNYKKMIDTAKTYFANKDVRDIRKIHVIEYRTYLEQKPVGPKSIPNFLTLLKTFMNWVKSDLGILSIVPPFPVIEVSEPVINWVSAEDQVKLLSHAREGDKPIFMFLMLSGIRPGEARALRVGDVDLTKGIIHVRATFSGKVYREKRKGKGAKPYVIPLHQEMIPYIQGRIKSALPGAWLFFNPITGGHISVDRLNDGWNIVRKRAGITYRLRLYDATRHSLASGLLARGESLFTVSKLLGYATIKTTERYAHSDIESLRRSVEKVSLFPGKGKDEAKAKKE